jgi:hypothetical protein
MAQGDEIAEEPRWWEVQNIPTALIRELRRRKNSNNIGFNYPASGDPSGVVYDFYNKHDAYKGPMTPWVRVFSNGTGMAGNGLVPKSSILNKNGNDVAYNGFLFIPGNGFYEAYGYKQDGNILKQDKAIIGYEADGNPHYIDLNYRSQFSYKWPSTFNKNNKIVASVQKTEVSSVLPPPNLDSIEIKTSKDMLAFATIKFKCYGLAQLEYLAPFFLTPRINVFVEIGWNLFNINSLIDLANTNECWSLIQTPQKTIDKWYQSYGNYGCITGIITKYNFSTQDGTIYDCSVELTSRQALFAGMPAENNVSTTVESKTDAGGKKIPTETKEYTGLKTFLKTGLPKLKQVIIDRKNFMEYIATNGIGNSEDYENSINTYFIKQQTFYDGKKENRVFIGRTDAPNVYKKPSVPVGDEGITYKSVSTGGENYKNLSYKDDRCDFDTKGDDEVWMQLDFLFEVANKFCTVVSNKTFTIDVDKIINAHPNLISCDPHVLIPNGIAPKFNIGKTLPDESYINTIKNNKLNPNAQSEIESQIKSGGYLKNGDPNQNNFLKSKFDVEITDVNDELYKSAKKVQTVFKTAGAYRDNLDTVINRLYYDIGGLSEDSPVDNISFPFIYDKEDEVKGEEIVLVDPTKKRPGSVKRTYKKFRYGNLKNIYISKTKVLEIVDNKEIETWQQFANAVLNVINEASNNFWKFQISQDDLGGLSIVDNNYVDLGDKSPSLKRVYVFDAGGTDSCIKNITLDTSLTSEQATLTLFQAGINQPDDSKTSMSAKNSSIPATNFIDRLDTFNKEETETGESNTVPSQEEVTVDKNELISAIQTHGFVDKVLNMTFAYVKTGETPNESEKNYKQLNLSTDLKDKLSQIIDDQDTEFNLPLYSGISPNFSLTVTFDGIFGFRMFQHFGISNFPKPYIPENVLFMVTDVTHYVTPGNGKWETVVGCLARCVADQNIELVPV